MQRLVFGRSLHTLLVINWLKIAIELNVRGRTRNFYFPEELGTMRALKPLQLRHFQSKPPCNCHKK